jgi:hypothetical protein
MVGGSHEVCASDGPYSINGGTAQILCKLDANPTLVTVSWPKYYHEIFWTKDDCMVDYDGKLSLFHCMDIVTNFQ